LKITFATSSASFEADFNDSPAARMITRSLPIISVVSRWGDEIYFEIGLNCQRDNETMALEVGDIGYWPQGRCLCVFFGPTPASSGDAPVPASPVVLVGKAKASPDLLRTISEGESITVSAH
jgi:hypothetical protein